MRFQRASDAIATAPGRCRVSDVGVLLVGVAIAVGIAGVVMPVLPGALLVWAAIAVWAITVGSATAWTVLVGVSVVIGGAQVLKLLVPGRQLRSAGVPRRSIVVGLVLAGVGFFVIPVVGFFVGFPLGIYVEERRRLGPHAPAWLSTRKGLRAIGLSILIELSATVLAAAVWLATVLV